MIPVFINDEQREDSIDCVLLESQGESILLFLECENQELSVLLANDRKIRTLNKQYRGQDRATDVLSFSYGDEEEAGDIVISPEVIYENAVRYGEDFLDELLKIIIHGILHIFGYDHEGDEEEARRMFEKQDEYFYKVKKRLEGE